MLKWLNVGLRCVLLICIWEGNISTVISPDVCFKHPIRLEVKWRVPCKSYKLYVLIQHFSAAADKSSRQLLCHHLLRGVTGRHASCVLMDVLPSPKTYRSCECSLSLGVASWPVANCLVVLGGNLFQTDVMDAWWGQRAERFDWMLAEKTRRCQKYAIVVSEAIRIQRNWFRPPGYES